MSDKPEYGICSLERIIFLGKSPRIVIPGNIIIAVADPHLVIECFRIVIPHLLKPVKTKLHFGSEVRARSRPEQSWMISEGDQQKRDHVTVGLDKLHIIAGVEPATRYVDRPTYPHEISNQRAVAIESGWRVSLGRLVVQMRRTPVHH